MTATKTECSGCLVCLQASVDGSGSSANKKVEPCNELNQIDEQILHPAFLYAYRNMV